jgi:hypothetical protein
MEQFLKIDFDYVVVLWRRAAGRQQLNMRGRESSLCDTERELTECSSGGGRRGGLAIILFGLDSFWPPNPLAAS